MPTVFNTRGVVLMAYLLVLTLTIDRKSKMVENYQAMKEATHLYGGKMNTD
jgi:hypothetical protein